MATLAEALEGCGFVTATTSRDRDQYFRVIDVREAAQRIVSEAQRSPAAVIFGAERSGLTNEELETAHALIRIPASELYPSLNLAMAVQLVTYELYRAHGAAAPAISGAAPLATAQAMDRLYVHLAQVLAEINFRDRTQKGTALTLTCGAALELIVMLADNGIALGALSVTDPSRERDSSSVERQRTR